MKNQLIAAWHLVLWLAGVFPAVCAMEFALWAGGREFRRDLRRQMALFHATKSAAEQTAAERQFLQAMSRRPVTKRSKRRSKRGGKR